MAKSYGGVLGHPSGKVGNVVFYTYRGKPCIRAAPRKIGKKKFAKDHRFINTRKNAAEFSRAGKAVKLIYQLMQRYGFTSTDGSSRWRMQRLMMEVIKADKSNEWGMRNVADGDLQQLEGFSFLPKERFSGITTGVDHYDRRMGSLGIALDISKYDYPGIAELVAGQCKVTVLAMAIDFSLGKFDAVMLDHGTCKSSGDACQVKLWGHLKIGNDIPLLIITRIQSLAGDSIPVGSSTYDVLEISNVVRLRT